MTPKIYLETFIIISVISIVYIASFSDRSLETNLSYIAILIFGAQKCLPQINNIYSLSINFKVATPSVNNFLKVLDGGQIHSIIEHKYNDLKFEKSIKIENISFHYNNHTPNIINKFNFEILKGDQGPNGLREKHACKYYFRTNSTYTRKYLGRRCFN